MILGSGLEDQEKAFLDLAKSFPEQIGVKIGFDDSLARRIFAGSDFFIMPSRFEHDPAICNEIWITPLHERLVVYRIQSYQD